MTAAAETRTARIEKVERLAQGPRSIVTVRLSDGATLRAHAATVEHVRREIGREVGGVMAYDVDAVGNRYNPRAASPEQVAAFRRKHGLTPIGAVVEAEFVRHVERNADSHHG